MGTAATVVFGSLKACLLLAAAFGVTFAMRRRPARLRAVVWATALIGAVCIPLVAAVVPAIPIPMPVVLAELWATDGGSSPAATLGRSIPHRDPSVTASPSPILEAEVSVPAPSRAAVDLWLVGAGLWLAGLVVLVSHQGVGLLRITRIVRRARPVDEPGWRAQLAAAGREVGCRRRIRLLASPEVDLPAVFGVLRPVVILPSHADAWVDGRRTAVLRHELVHVVRYDWPVRVAARFAAAVYWFNPLAWWAVRRLDLEQELACDEEVLSLGSRASTYACHLLGIARAAVPHPVVAAGLSMAKRSHLEERIMSILNRSYHRRVGLRLILPAVIVTAALVPAIAAVQPADRAPRTASPELAAAVAEIEAAEKRLEPGLDRVREIERELRPTFEAIETIEVEIDREAIARIEAEMAPILQQIEVLGVDMAPLHAQLESMAEKMRDAELHIEDGTLEEIQDQIHDQMALYLEELESIHIDLEPYHDRLEQLHDQLEPYHEKIVKLTEEQTARVQEAMARTREVMDREQESLRDLEIEMERVHDELEPFHREMERLGDRLQEALKGDVARALRSHLGAVTGPEAPFGEAAARLLDDASIRLQGDLIEVDISRREAREILGDLFSPVRIGTEEAFDRALAAAVDELADLEIRVE